MAFFKRQQQPINDKWYPRSVVVGNPLTTAQLSKRIAQESTVARADVDIDWIEYVGPAPKKSSASPDEDTQQPEAGEGSGDGNGGGGGLEM